MFTLTMAKVVVRQLGQLVAEHIAKEYKIKDNGGWHICGTDSDGNAFGPYAYASYSITFDTAEVSVSPP